LELRSLNHDRVTHDVEEALVLSDRVIVMRSKPGRLHREFVIDLPRPRRRTEASVQKWKELLLGELDLSTSERFPLGEATPSLAEV
jgi:sulfonate transport system ATP-binding protein